MEPKLPEISLILFSSGQFIKNAKSTTSRLEDFAFGKSGHLIWNEKSPSPAQSHLKMRSLQNRVH